MTMYPNIQLATIEIAHDNGLISRCRSADSIYEDLQQFLSVSEYTPEQLANINDWLGTISKEDMKTVCNGEEGDISNVMLGSPIHTDKLLDDIFTYVCC